MCSALIPCITLWLGPKCALHSFHASLYGLVLSVLCTHSCITLRSWSEVCSALIPCILYWCSPALCTGALHSFHASPFGSGPKCALHSFMHHPSTLVRSVLCTRSYISPWVPTQSVMNASHSLARSTVCSPFTHASHLGSLPNVCSAFIMHHTLWLGPQCALHSPCITLWLGPQCALHSVIPPCVPT